MDRQTFPSTRYARRTARFAQRGGGGQPPHPASNNKTPMVATNRLVYALPCVWNAKPSLQLASLDAGASPRTPPLNYKTLVVATNCLVCAPPWVWTAKPSPQPAALDRRLASLDAGGGGGQPPHPPPPSNDKTPMVATNRLVYALPCMWNAKPSFPTPPPPAYPPVPPGYGWATSPYMKSTYQNAQSQLHELS